MASIKDISNLDTDSILGALGLQRAGSADWAAPAMGALVVGLAVGGLLGLLFAPKSGNELRKDLRRRADEAKEDFETAFQKADKDVQTQVGRAERSTGY